MKKKNGVLTIRDTASRTEPMEFGSLKQFSSFLQDVASEPGFGSLGSYRNGVLNAMKRGRVTSWLRTIGENGIADRLENFAETPFDSFANAFFILHEAQESRKVMMDNVIGLEDEKEFLRNRFLRVGISKTLNQKYRKKTSGNVLLYGPPGCGKTLLANAIAGKTSRIFHKADAAQLMEAGIHNVFSVICKLRDAVVFIDEMETLAMTRDGDDFRPRRVTNSFLTLFDTDLESCGVSLIGATNAPWLLDNALLRSGRFENLIYVGVPNAEARAKLFRYYSSGLPLEEVDFESLAKKTEFYSCSDIELICQEAACIPWSEAVVGKPERSVSQDDFEAAMERIESTTLPWFESASNLVMSDSGKVRFAPMLKEVQRYKKWRGG